MHTTTTGEARPPQGLSLRETADGLAVIGHPHRTYKARHELRQHGARWNRERRQWEATTPADCDTLRRWLNCPEPTAAPSTYIYII